LEVGLLHQSRENSVRILFNTIALALILWVGTGCFILASISGSIAGLSDSVSNSLDASSPSTSTWLQELDAYVRDVRVATHQAVETHQDSDALISDLGRVAELHGVTHWEAHPATARHRSGAGQRWHERSTAAGLPE
jgi:hypothetical protein